MDDDNEKARAELAADVGEFYEDMIQRGLTKRVAATLAGEYGAGIMRDRATRERVEDFVRRARKPEPQETFEEVIERVGTAARRLLDDIAAALQPKS